MKTKVCTKCGEQKLLLEFTKDRTKKNGLSSRCKACSVILSQDYRKRNIEKVKQYENFKYTNDKLLIPWYKHWKAGRQRCNDKNASNYKYYGAKKINFLLTIDEIKILWFRDKAYLMKEAQLSRKNHNKNYVFDNCEFIEKKDNVGERNKRVAKEKRK
jgi:hypothetical protein